MRQPLRRTTFALGSLALVLAGCGGSPEPSPPVNAPPDNPPVFNAPHEKEVPRQESGITTDEVKKEVNEAISAVSEYATQAKDEYLKVLETQLADFNVQLEDFKKQASESSADMKVKLEEQQVVLKEKIDEAREKLEEFRKSDQWENMKGMMDNAMAEVRSALSIDSATGEVAPTAERMPEQSNP